MDKYLGYGNKDKKGQTIQEGDIVIFLNAQHKIVPVRWYDPVKAEYIIRLGLDKSSWYLTPFIAEECEIIKSEKGGSNGTMEIAN